MCYYHFYCIYLPLAIVDCQDEGCPLRLCQIFKGEYVILNYIHFDKTKRKICRNCVEELVFVGGGGGQRHLIR